MHHTLMDAGAGPEVAGQYAAATRRAVDVGVFGVLSYVVNGEIYWRNDRLAFLQRQLRT